MWETGNLTGVCARSPSAATTIDPEVKEMSTISSEEIISILKEKIENYDAMCQEQETGKVISVGDGIATIYGIDHAMYGEIVTFENGEKGMVQDIRQDTIGCILFGKDTGIKEGTVWYVRKRKPESRLVKDLSAELSTRWASRSTEREL